MRKKYKSPFFEVEKLTIIQSICASITGEGFVPELGGGDEDDDGFVGEGAIGEIGGGED